MMRYRWLRSVPISLALAALLAVGVAPVEGQNGSNAAAKPAASKSTEAASAASTETADDGSDEWIDGRSDEWAETAEKRTLTGKVRINRPDGYLNADLVEMFFDPDATEQTVDHTVADGNVSLKENDVVATCDHAVFTEGNNVITMTGSVVVLFGKSDRMECEKFVYDRRTGERHGSGNVKFRIRYTQSEDEKAAGEDTTSTTTEPPTDDSGD
ncbi:MAG: hypothetical protein O3A46_07050 [Candidatus Poribacteria bacterium]|nr:hypothetical protein [Candidatus Poribacteria bacterium]